jgi:hypothetical protein
VADSSARERIIVDDLGVPMDYELVHLVKVPLMGDEVALSP